MPTPTYAPLATITLGSNASSVSFSNINQGYRDLMLVITGRTSTPGPDSLLIRFNSDSASNYRYVRMVGTSSANSSYAESGNGIAIGVVTNSSTMASFFTNIMDYSATDKHKSTLSRSGQGNGWVFASSGRWANTAAITSLQIIEPSQTITSGTTLSLYGVVA